MKFSSKPQLIQNISRFIAALTLASTTIAAHCAPSIEVNGNTYEIETVTGLLTEYRSTIENQVWFGNGELAQKFSNELGLLLGTPNFELGPMFGYEIQKSPGGLFTVSFVYKPTNFHLEYDNRAQEQNAWGGVSYTYAVAKQVSAAQIPEPSTISLVGFVTLLLIGSKRLHTRRC